MKTINITILLAAFCAGSSEASGGDCLCIPPAAYNQLKSGVDNAAQISIKVQEDLAMARTSIAEPAKAKSLFTSASSGVREIKAILEREQANLVKIYAIDTSIVCDPTLPQPICSEASIGALFKKLNELAGPLSGYLQTWPTLACGDQCTAEVHDAQNLQYQSQCVLGVIADSLDKCAAFFG